VPFLFPDDVTGDAPPGAGPIEAGLIEALFREAGLIDAVAIDAAPIEAGPIEARLIGAPPITVGLLFPCAPRFTKMLDVWMRKDLPLMEIAVRARRM
jgi:hypothetical protein